MTAAELIKCLALLDPETELEGYIGSEGISQDVSWWDGEGDLDWGVIQLCAKRPPEIVRVVPLFLIGGVEMPVAVEPGVIDLSEESDELTWDKFPAGLLSAFNVVWPNGRTVRLTASTRDPQQLDGDDLMVSGLHRTVANLRREEKRWRGAAR